MSRRVAVTGSASGIGRAVAALLAERGDTVIGVDLKGADVCADLSKALGRRDAVTGVWERCGGVLDALVTCAGLSKIEAATVSVNYFGTAELIEALRPALAASEAPRVAAVASISATQPFDSDVVEACLHGDEQAALHRVDDVIARGDGRQVYPSSKVAVARWLRRICVGPGWADAGIAVNAVAPGVVLTPMAEPLLADEKMRAVTEEAVPMPLHGFAPPEVVARALCWLASAETTHITGQILYVDGGAEATLRGPEVF